MTDDGTIGDWAREAIWHETLAAPDHLAVEVAPVLRPMELRGQLTRTDATLAHADLLDREIEYFPYRACSDRVWQLRSNVTPFDACYVAVAEQCSFVVPPQS